MSGSELVHPGLMSNERLVQIFAERGLKTDGLRDAKREVLMSIYERYCMPYPQRSRKPRREGDERTAARVEGDAGKKRKPDCSESFREFDVTRKKQKVAITWP